AHEALQTLRETRIRRAKRGLERVRAHPEDRMGTRNATLVSGNSAAWEQGGRPTRCASRLKPRTGCRKTKTAYYFFFFAVFLAADFAFFFVAISVSLMVPSGGCPLAGLHPFMSSCLLRSDSTNPSYTIFSLACTRSVEAIVDSLPDSDTRNRRHGDRRVSLIER